MHNRISELPEYDIYETQKHQLLNQFTRTLPKKNSTGLFQQEVPDGTYSSHHDCLEMNFKDYQLSNYLSLIRLVRQQSHRFYMERLRKHIEGLNLLEVVAIRSE